MSDHAVPSRNTFSMRTGVAYLRALTPSVLLDLALKQLDRDVLTGPLLHEIVHHACANSAVNIAMQYRWLELLRLTLSSPAFGHGIHESEIERAADLAAAEAVLQPLAEGLAHFAEFDCALPTSGNVRGTTIGFSDALLWRLLATRRDADSHVDSFFAAQRAEQLDPRTIARKADVLCNPMFPATGHDSYLVGYLFIKTLWSRFAAGRATPPLRAAAFLEYVMYYLYEDWGLAQVLMTPGPIDVQRFGARVVERCQGLLRPDLETRALAFLADKGARQRARGTLVRGAEEARHGAFQGLDLPTEETLAGMMATAAFYDRKLGVGGALSEEPQVKNVRNLQHQVLMTALPAAEPKVGAFKQRNRVPDGAGVRVLDFILEIPQRKRAFCHLFDVEVEIRGRDGRELLLSVAGEGGGVLPTPAAARFSEVPQPGRLFAVVASTAIPWRVYCFLLSGGQWIALWGHGDEPTDNKEQLQLAETITGELEIELGTGLSFPSLNEYVTTHALAKEQVGETADAGTRAIVDALRGLLEGAGWSALTAAPAGPDFGLRNVVPKTADVRGLAAAGLAAALDPDRAAVEEALRQSGFDLTSVLATARKVEVARGLTLIRSDQNLVTVTI